MKALELEKGESWLVPPRFLDKHKYVLAPTVKWGVRPGNYSFRTELFEMCIRDRLYISNNERLADEAGRRYGVSLQNTPWAGQVTKNRFFIAFNAAQLMKDVQENPRLTRMLGSDAAMSVSYTHLR